MCDPSAFWKQGREHSLIFFIHIPCSITNSPFAWGSTSHSFMVTCIISQASCCSFLPAAFLLLSEIEFQCRVCYLPCLHDGSNAHSSSARDLQRDSAEVLAASWMGTDWNPSVVLWKVTALCTGSLLKKFVFLSSPRICLENIICLAFEKSTSSACTKLVIYGCM